jgi:hypothetical protein
LDIYSSSNTTAKIVGCSRKKINQEAHNSSNTKHAAHSNKRVIPSQNLKRLLPATAKHAVTNPILGYPVLQSSSTLHL